MVLFIVQILEFFSVRVAGNQPLWKGEHVLPSSDRVMVPDPNSREVFLCSQRVEAISHVFPEKCCEKLHSKFSYSLSCFIGFSSIVFKIKIEAVMCKGKRVTRVHISEKWRLFYRFKYKRIIISVWIKAEVSKVFWWCLKTADCIEWGKYVLKSVKKSSSVTFLYFLILRLL